MFRDHLSSIEELIEEARNGRMFILVDAEDRENEGDLVIPAQMATPDAINFMAKHGRGLVCLSLTQQRACQLRLDYMAPHPEARKRTAFTVSIEAREGVTTGISAHDRAHTIQVAIDPETLQRTTLGELRVGDSVNVEVDILAKHVERLLARREEAGV